jgi:hypothetical protein
MRRFPFASDHQNNSDIVLVGTHQKATQDGMCLGLPQAMQIELHRDIDLSPRQPLSHAPLERR